MSDAQGFISGNGDEKFSLIVVFLRGGADGLSLVPPVEDDDYHRARPRIAVSRKDAVPLDGFFGLNPLLSDLKPIYEEGALAVVHAAGTEDSTRSHFEAQDLMEHGGIVAGGWLGRFLKYRKNAAAGALSAIALGSVLPECLRGAPSATVLKSMDDFSLGEGAARLTRELERLYAAEQGELGRSARDTFDALARIEHLRGTPYQPANGAIYEQDSFAEGMMQIARLIKARVGLEAAAIDLGGWDSHFTQGTIMGPLMTRLSKGLGAFYRDLGDANRTTSVVVMTEFGRRVRENTAFGTDHGRGGVMFVIGGGVRGGRVLGPWPGLSDDLLVGPGDLPVIHNYRNILAPVLERHGAGGAWPQIFPEFNLQPTELYA